MKTKISLQTLGHRRHLAHGGLGDRVRLVRRPRQVLGGSRRVGHFTVTTPVIRPTPSASRGRAYRGSVQRPSKPTCSSTATLPQPLARLLQRDVHHHRDLLVASGVPVPPGPPRPSPAARGGRGRARGLRSRRRRRRTAGSPARRCARRRSRARSRTTGTCSGGRPTSWPACGPARSRRASARALRHVLPQLALDLRVRHPRLELARRQAGVGGGVGDGLRLVEQLARERPHAQPAQHRAHRSGAWRRAAATARQAGTVAACAGARRSRSACRARARCWRRPPPAARA